MQRFSVADKKLGIKFLGFRVKVKKFNLDKAFLRCYNTTMKKDKSSDMTLDILIKIAGNEHNIRVDITKECFIETDLHTPLNCLRKRLIRIWKQEETSKQ
jgi:hypothetical protein